MLGLGCLVSGDDGAEKITVAPPTFDGTLPYDGSYIYLEEDFKYETTGGTPGATEPVTIHGYNHISFDDSHLESWDFEGSQDIYNETGLGSAGNKYQDAGIDQDDTVTITGNIVRYDNGQVYDGDDTSSDGFIKFVFNSTSADDCKVYIDIQNNSSITANNIDRVSSDGSFQVTKQISDSGGVARFSMTATSIAPADGNSETMNPGVRMYNLRMTKS